MECALSESRYSFIKGDALSEKMFLIFPFKSSGFFQRLYIAMDTLIPLLELRFESNGLNPRTQSHRCLFLAATGSYERLQFEQPYSTAAGLQVLSVAKIATVMPLLLWL